MCAYRYEENHDSKECRKVVNSKERKDILKRYGRCYICLKQAHRDGESRSKAKRKKYTIELLGGKNFERQCLTLSGFGQEEPKEKCHNIHEIKVKPLK